MIDDFVAAINDNRQPICNAETGYWVQALCDAAFRSAREKNTLEVEPCYSS